MAKTNTAAVSPESDGDVVSDAGAIFARLVGELVEGKKQQVDWKKQNVKIRHTGKELTLPADPADMTYDVAIDTLQRAKKDDEQLTAVHEIIEAFPLEALVAFNAAMKEAYGWAQAVAVQHWWGRELPQMLSIQVNVDEWIQVPHGSFHIPGIENKIKTIITQTAPGRQNLVITGEVRKRERHILLELAEITRRILRENSIYRGKALHIKTNGDGSLDLNNPPSFMDLRRVNMAELILNRDVQYQIDTNLLAPVRFTDKVRAAKIPLRRGILLEGPFGVGKTMATRLTAKVCTEFGWTFVTVDRGQSLTEALLFATRYQPAVVFCEDIDRTMGERDDAANDLLNVISGVIGNDAEVMVVLTTNHVDRIEPAMLRPGRLDAVISMNPPDAESVGRLIKLYARNKLAAGETLDAIGVELAGNIPAVVREVVERSKLAMIAAEHDKIAEQDLLVAARAMANHRKLLEPKQVAPTSAELLASGLRGVVGKIEDDPKFAKTLTEMDRRIVEIHDNVC